MRLPLLASIVCLMLLHPFAASAQRFNVYVGQVRIADPQATAQKQQYRELMAALGAELLKAPLRVRVESAEELQSWFLDKDWKELVARGVTHFIVAIPKAESEGKFNISWEVGALGTVGGEKVPVFAGRLSEALEALIVLDGDLALIQGATPRNKAIPVAERFRKIFPELGPALLYYVSCIQLDVRPPNQEQWLNRRERLLMSLLERLMSQNQLQHVSELLDLKQEARAACLEADKARAAAEKADFLLSGTTSGRSKSKIFIEVNVDNRPGLRRQRNDLTYQPGQVQDTVFLTQLAEWTSKYEGNRRWRLTACGSSKDFWAEPPNIESLADRLLIEFQGKLAIIAPSPGVC